MSNIFYVRYNISTGKIVMLGSCPEDHIIHQQEISGLNLLTGEGSIEEHYVDLNDETIKEKEAINYTVNKVSILADGIDEFIISNLPVGISVTWPDEQVDIINDGSITFCVDMEGTYVFKLSGVPYLETEVTVEATI